jgi:hypothetical protein
LASIINSNKSKPMPVTRPFINHCEIQPFEINGKTILDSYYTAANVLVIEFTDGTRIRFFAEETLLEETELNIKK